MSSSKKPLKIVQKLIRQIWQLSRTATKKLMSLILRGLFVFGRRSPRFSGAGFVLPTVVMVLLVLVLLTSAILFRSFDRSKNASNIRASQASIAAASPAIERAKAKIDKLFDDPRLPRATPSEVSLYNVIKTNEQYTFGDETRLKIAFDISGTISGNPDGIDPLPLNGSPRDEETSTTAWRFPIDTDNNGRFDSYTIYGIYLRNPPRNNTGDFARKRNPLETRTPPMENVVADPNCAAAQGTSASLVGSGDWYKSGAKLKKAFYVYTVNVPITQPPAGDPAYEAYQGNKGFTALEYQQDRGRVPLTNNAVVYEDDLEITPGAGIKLNGRVMTNSNLLVGTRNANSPVEFYQVSSQDSCFYQEENAKILVGGNVAIGGIEGDAGFSGVNVDLFETGAVPTQTVLGSSNTGNSSTEIAYNSQAYEERVDQLVSDWINANPSSDDPQEVTDVLNANPAQDPIQLRKKALTNYFKARTRRVPFLDTGANDTPNNYQDTRDNLRPAEEWRYPVDPADNYNNYNGVTLTLDQFEATQPDRQEAEGKETKLGDRVLVGNGLPGKWWKDGKFVGDRDTQDIQPDTNWTVPGSPATKRTRTTRITELSDLGNTDRDGFWESNAALAPQTPLEGIGGLRVVTGAGVYRAGSLTPLTPDAPQPFDNPATFGIDEYQLTPVWPDTMPMWIDANADNTPEVAEIAGDLVMRATAVYHYAQSADDPTTPTVEEQVPIACISSYYDPSTPQTAENRNGLPGLPAAPAGLSHNGVSYPASGTRSSGIGQATPDANGIFGPPAAGAEDPESGGASLVDQLYFQANLVFPNGRLVNEPLRKALQKVPGERTLSEQSAIDSTICALDILQGGLSPDDSVIPHAAIYETAFLDARQVKAVEGNDGTLANYDLEVSQRQPLEVRATVLDLNLLRQKPIGRSDPYPDPEYLLPDSGIIYATRDDGLVDASSPQAAVDFQLDATRRPNAIMLINGSILARGDTSNAYNLVTPVGAEKGLILATNLPAYVKADAQGFNLHQTPANRPVEEFTDRLATYTPTWSRANFYDNRTAGELEGNFACRDGDPRVPNCNAGGDTWRAASVLADSVTLLSNAYQFGFRIDGDYDLRNNIGDDLIDNVGNAFLADIASGFDINGNGGGTPNAADTVDEKDYHLDLNGNGNATDTGVDETQIKLTAAVKRRVNGFTANNFVTSREFQDADYTINPNSGTPPGSSYFNNFVTPIQRRVESKEYLMEVCTKLPVSECGPDDWWVTPPDNTTSPPTPGVKASDATSLTTLDIAGVHQAGTTAQAAIDKYKRYARRVAFLRNPAPANELVNYSTGNPLVVGELPTPLGITDANSVVIVPYNNGGAINTIRNAPNALWFKATNDPADPTSSGNETFLFDDNKALFLQKTAIGTAQPLLAPVLQLHTPTRDGSNPANAPNETVDTASTSDTPVVSTSWLQRAEAATFNLVAAGGDTPTRAIPGPEPNGGLHNFVRFLENWGDPANPTAPTDPQVARISGSFIQFKRSAYATAPFRPVLDVAIPAAGETIFGYRRGYRTENGRIGGVGTQPNYVEPRREWGFDVGLLSQLPDLFSQRFTVNPSGPPDEFYREVGRDDPWVKTLMCAAVADDPQGRGGPGANYNDYALPDPQQRPTDCPPLPYPRNDPT
jgi:type II secretory pathway pseudopilin PulG